MPLHASSRGRDRHGSRAPAASYPPPSGWDPDQGTIDPQLLSAQYAPAGYAAQDTATYSSPVHYYGTVAYPGTDDTEPGFDSVTHFAHLNMSASQMDGTGQDTDSSTQWPNQDLSCPQPETSGDTYPPQLTDNLPPTQVCTQQHTYDQQYAYDYVHHQDGTMDPAHWRDYTDPSQAGPSSDATAATADNPFACPYQGCTNAYSRQCDLDKHMHNHTKPRKCDICRARRAETKDLNRHMWTHHPDVAKARGLPKEEDRCETCGYAGRKDNVKRHRDTKGH